MLLSVDLQTVQPHMLSSIFKNPIGLNVNLSGEKHAMSPSRNSSGSFVSYNEGLSPSRSVPLERERSLSVDTGSAMGLGGGSGSGSGSGSGKFSPTVTMEAPKEDYVQKTKKTAGYLRLLLHSRRCRGMCNKTGCIKTSSVVDHLGGCFDARCAFPGCTTSKKLLDHYETCGLNSLTHRSPSHGSSGYANFCLLCSLVPQSTSSPTNPSSYLSPEASMYNSHHMDDRYSELVYNDSRSPREIEEENRHDSNSPIVFDEMMEFNKVPFQDTPAEYHRHSMSSDFQESNYNDEPPRKIRSKSMNAASIEHWSG